MVRELKCIETMAGGGILFIKCVHIPGKKSRGFLGALRCSINTLSF